MSDNPNEDALNTVPMEEVDDALFDLDPNDAIEVGYDPDTDTEDDPALDEEHPYEPEDVPGAEPVDDAVADVTIPSAEDEIESDDVDADEEV